MKAYIVEARRYGARKGHHYLVGAYSTIEAAKTVADQHTDDRAGKYACLVFETDCDTPDADAEPIEVYRTEPIMHVNQCIGCQLLKEKLDAAQSELATLRRELAVAKRAFFLSCKELSPWLHKTPANIRRGFDAQAAAELEASDD